MGTNYYLMTEVQDGECVNCGAPHYSEKGLHIGKSSSGWCFALMKYDHLNIKSLNHWRPLLSDSKNKILDEYGQKIENLEMLTIITERGRPSMNFEKIPSGYASWNDFHRINFSEFGPNGMLRHKIDGVFCVGHGVGTYDYMEREFS